MMIVGMFFLDAMEVAMEVQFNVAERQDLTVTFAEPTSAGAIYELAGLEGVMHLEPLRTVPARLVHGHRSRQTAITGLASGFRLHRVIDSDLETVELPPEGIVLSTKLAEIVGVTTGDMLTIEVLEGARPVREVVVSELVDEFLGTAAYMDLDALHRIMREGRVLSGAFLQVDGLEIDGLYSRFKATPTIVGVALKDAAIRSFRDTVQANMGIIIFFNQIFSSIIAFGVIYNAARISLSERSWELASLRVIGFTKGEISYILLGEFGMLTAVAIPLGIGIGYGLAALTVYSVGDTELYRIPLYVAPATYGMAILGVVTAALVSSLVVANRLGRLNVASVLKTRE